MAYFFFKYSTLIAGLSSILGGTALSAGSASARGRSVSWWWMDKGIIISWLFGNWSSNELPYLTRRWYFENIYSLPLTLGKIGWFHHQCALQCCCNMWSHDRSSRDWLLEFAVCLNTHVLFSVLTYPTHILGGTALLTSLGLPWQSVPYR